MIRKIFVLALGLVAVMALPAAAQYENPTTTTAPVTAKDGRSRALAAAGSFSLLWRIFAVNAALFAAGVALLALTPASVHSKIRLDELITLILGAFISLLPATRLYGPLIRAYETQSWLRWVTIAALVVIYVLAIARAVTVPFQPFIYFRF